MPADRRRVYLERADDDPAPAMAPWKFYEVRVHDHSVTLRWGRIGCPGRSLTIHFSSLEAARRYAARRVRQKRRRGYRGAIEGVRRRRPPRPPRPRPQDPRQQDLFT